MNNSDLENYMKDMLNEEPAPANAPYETLEQKAIAEEIRKGDTHGYVAELAKFNNEMIRDCE